MSDSNAPQHRPNRLPYQARFRQSAHQDAHAEHDEPGEITSHPLVCADPPALVDTNDQLDDLIQHLQQAGTFAYDSEFIGELTYIPKLCLIQVATTKRVALVDPLAEALDLAPFWQLLCDPSIHKIVHAGQQDLEPIFRNTGGRAPANILDVQIAAGMARLPYPLSLGKLVMQVLGIRIGKGLTFTYWDQRPLSAKQLRYAADDVRYLPAVHAGLKTILDESGHWQWAAEESEALCDPKLYLLEPLTDYQRIRGATGLAGPGQVVLRELFNWREQLADAENVPPRSLVRDEVLLEMARHPISDVQELQRVKGLPRPVESQYGRELVQRTAAALASPRDQWPPVKTDEEEPPAKFEADALWSLIQCLSVARGIDPALVSGRQEVGRLSRAIRGHKPLDDFRLMSGWRRQAVGESLLAMVQKKQETILRWQPGGPTKH